MPNIGIIFFIIVLMFYLVIELERLANKIRSKMFLTYPDDDEFFDMNDFSGLPFMSARDFSGDDGRAKRVNGDIIPILSDPRFTEEQKTQLLLPEVKRADTIEKKPVKNEKVEEVEEDVEFEFKTLKAVRKKAVKKRATKKQ